MKTLGLFIETYPYLVSCVFFLVLFAMGLFFPGEQRRPMLFSALLSTPFAFAELILVPNYWKPTLLWGERVGVEDLAFAFFTGGIVWMGSAYFIRDRLVLTGRVKPRTERYLKCILCGSLGSTLLFLTGTGFIWSILGGMYILGFILFVTLRNLRALALWGAATFLPIYALILKLMFTAWPDYIRQWNLPSLRGFLFGMPIEELVWALGFGFTWPLITAHVLDIQVRDAASALSKPDSSVAGSEG